MDSAKLLQHCPVCKQTIEAKTTGRPRKYCSPMCKQKDYRSSVTKGLVTHETVTKVLPSVTKPVTKPVTKVSTIPPADKVPKGPPSPSQDPDGFLAFYGIAKPIWWGHSGHLKDKVKYAAVKKKELGI